MTEICTVPYWQPGMSNEEWARLHSEYQDCLVRTEFAQDPRVPITGMSFDEYLSGLISSYELHAQHPDPAAQFSAYGYLSQIMALDPSYVPTVIIPEGAAPSPGGVPDMPSPVGGGIPSPDPSDPNIPSEVGAVGGSDLNTLVGLSLIFL